MSGLLRFKRGHYPAIWKGIASSRFRFSKRRPVRKAERSDLGSRSLGDSNSFEGVFETEERRLSGAPRGDAPKRNHVELFEQ